MTEDHPEAGRHPELNRFIAVLERLRRECPWDREQTHHSLVHYLVEETCEVVDAIETGADDELREELGDVLLQVIFHATIAAEEGRFDIEAVAAGVADKLVSRHPWVFQGQDAPDDLNATWEAGKRREKGRTSSLDGIPERLSAMARAAKVVSRTRSHQVGVPMASEPIGEAEFGDAVLELVQRAQASGVDPEQATRAALRRFEAGVREHEGA